MGGDVLGFELYRFVEVGGGHDVGAGPSESGEVVGFAGADGGGEVEVDAGGSDLGRGVGDVEEPRVGIDGQNHALELGHVGVLPTVIGEEADDRRGCGTGGGSGREADHGEDKCGEARNTKSTKVWHIP